MTMIIDPNAVLPPPLAEGATVAERPAGPCSLCKRGILAGQRYAVTVPDGQAAHLMCISVAALRPRRRLVIR